MVSLLLKREYLKGRLCFRLPDDGALLELLRRELERGRDKHKDFYRVTIQPPRRKRTDDQNKKYWAMVTEIAREIGDDVESVSDDIKMKAVSRGYPYKVSKINGAIRPLSSTRADTRQMAVLIETAYEVGAFLGVNFEV